MAATQEENVRGESVQVSLSPARVRNALVAVAVVLTAVSAAAQLAWSPDGLHPQHAWHDASLILISRGESTFANWWSVVLLLAAALLAALIGLDRRRRREAWWRHWLVFAAVLFYMSADEGSGLHESSIRPIQENLGTGGAFFFAWVVLAIPVALFVVAYFWRFVWSQPPAVRTAMLLAAALYLGSALGLEMIEGVMTDSANPDFDALAAAATAEELGEMIAIAVLLQGLVAALPAGGLPLTMSRRAQEP